MITRRLFWASVFFLLVIIFPVADLSAQCSICTKTASQLGKESAEGLNSGIVYLMLLPFAIGGFIAWRWWKNENETQAGV
jgi:amino acid transporter